jgi:hypothetical protein
VAVPVGLYLWLWLWRCLLCHMSYHSITPCVGFCSCSYAHALMLICLYAYMLICLCLYAYMPLCLCAYVYANFYALHKFYYYTCTRLLVFYFPLARPYVIDMAVPSARRLLLLLLLQLCLCVYAYMPICLCLFIHAVHSSMLMSRLADRCLTTNTWSRLLTTPSFFICNSTWV